MNKSVDVMIAGAGPVGLLLAIELRLGGADVMVLERLAAPNLGTKANVVGPLGAEALQRRGMGAALAEAEDRGFAARGPAGAAMRARAASFRGVFALVPIRPPPGSDPQRRIRWVNQHALEAILAERAAALGIEVRRGCEVTSLEQREDGVEVRWTTAAGPDSARCAWLAGCDGARGPVRTLAGFTSTGSPPSLTMYQAVLDLDHPERLPVGATRTPEGSVLNGPRPRWVALHDYRGPPADRDAPVTRDEIEAVLRRISGADVRVTAMDEANRFSDVTRLADTYRRGRVLIGGDAAHVHSPVGGQGLSLGLVDAANLGWKLAAVVRRDKPDTLLDTYTSERRPVAAAVLANTLAQVALMRPDPRSNALREVFAELMRLDAVNAYIDGLISGLATRYDLGSQRDAVGRLAGDRALGAGEARTSLFAAMAEGDGVLLDASPHGSAAGIAAGFTRLRCFPTEAGSSLLIRPDGCIAWAADAGDTAGLADALGRWFAPVAGVATSKGGSDLALL